MRILTIRELMQVKGQENEECIVAINQVLVRKSVEEKLKRAQQKLSYAHPSLSLLVTEGYRNPFYQEDYFLREFLKLSKENPALSFEELKELTHQFVALPSVAGHPTGGAVDVTITQDGAEWDMGGKIADFSRPEILPTYNPWITQEQEKKRQVLHDLLMEQGFAPFYGEWWHFSYGDREWAAFYGKEKALYSSYYFKCT